MGSWGTGKSTLMESIQNILQSYTDHPIPTVFFNAWRYERETVLATIPLVATILNVLLEELEKNIKLEQSSEKILTTAKRKLIENAKKFVKGSSVTVQAGIEGANVQYTFDPSKIINEKDDVNDFLENKIPNLHKGITLIGKIISSLTEKSEGDKPKKVKLVVFIDDLDRCSPKKALEVLESIKVLLGIEGIVYVIGISDKTISHLIDMQYKESDIKGEDYIKKIIQTQFRVPLWNRTDFAELIKNNILPEFRDSHPKFLDDETNYDIMSTAIESNPRELKRFINNLIIAYELFGNKEYVDEKSLLIVEALRTRWNDFFERFANNEELRKIIEENFLGLSETEFKNKIAAEREKSKDQTLSINYETISKMDIQLQDFLNSVKDTLFNITDWSLYIQITQSITEMNPMSSFDLFNHEMYDLLKKGQIQEFNKKRPKVLTLTNADLSGTDLSGAQLSGDTRLSGARFSGAVLSKANLSPANLINVDFTNAVLSGVDLSEANLTSANLTGANLTNANLSGTYLTNTQLIKADLTGARLDSANLIKADLTGANLTNANLSGANLINANLLHTVLTNTDLFHVRLFDAKIIGVIFDQKPKTGEVLLIDENQYQKDSDEYKIQLKKILANLEPKFREEVILVDNPNYRAYQI